MISRDVSFELGRTIINLSVKMGVRLLEIVEFFEDQLGLG